MPGPMQSVPAPNFEEAPIEPFTREEVERVLKVCDDCAEARTQMRRTAHHSIIPGRKQS